jgi:adenylosuccinate lyase
MQMYDFENYLSPFTWRYGTPAMRYLWSETNKRLLWRQLWVALAEVQAEYGLVKLEQVADLRIHMREINISRALEIEAETQHDLMAEIRVFAEQCPLGGGIIHLGATSTDIEDNADVLRLKASLTLLLQSLSHLLITVSRLIEEWADTPLMAFTHLQPAEPSTLGYRLAFYGQDLFHDYIKIKNLVSGVKGKGFKGAVGTSAGYSELVGMENLTGFEMKLSQKLDLPFFLITSQVYPRKQDFEVISILSGLGASLYKMAFDIRLLQSPPIGEIAEPFGDNQIGSSAMPFKRNPIQSEKINSLARYLVSLPRVAWDNAAHSLLERSLDDSANRRIILPEACLAADELLRTANSIFSNLQIDESAMERNLSEYGPFAATERVLIALVKAGADRQEMHECIRSHALFAWVTINQGNKNPLADDLCKDGKITKYLSEKNIRQLMVANAHIGDAPNRARSLAKVILDIVKKDD